MAAKKELVVGTLHTSGWVTDSLEGVDFLLAHYFLVQNSQYRFLVNVQSFQSLLAKNGENFGQLCQDVRDTLFSYLSTKFTNIAMNVYVTPDTGQNSSPTWTLRIECDFTDGAGVRYSLGRAIEMYGKQVKKINHFNVTGNLQES